MSFDALALVVAGAILHALWNVCAKKSSGGLPFVWLFGLVSLVCAAPVGLYAWMRNPLPITLPMLVVIIVSAAVHVLYSLVLQQGYRKGEFSVVYPLARGTGPLFSVLAAIIVLREMPSGKGWLGIAAILLGVLLVGGLPQLVRSSGDRISQGVLWGLLTGICIAGYTVIDGYAVKVLGMAPLTYYILGLAFRTLMLTPAALGSPEALASQWALNRRHIITVGVLSPLAYTLVLYAMVRAPLSYVAPVRELSMLIGVFFGAHLLREQYSVSRGCGTVLMVLGVVLLVLAR